MRVSHLLYRTLLIVSMFVSSLSLAQGTSVITGNLTDAATGKPVSDVVVTATSPALQGEAVVVTDAAGLYRLAQLPAGTYTVKFEKESFKPFSRSEITVRTDRTVRLNVQIQPEAVESGVITVVGRPPTVDVGSTTTGLSVGKDFISNIAFVQPNASGVRSFESLASVAPQVIADQYGFGFNGAQAPENLYLVDGVSVGNPAFGTNAAQFPLEFVEEANVITGGYMAEYGRATGGVINVVTKSGSNEFHGSVWGNWTPGVLSVAPRAIPNDNSVFTNVVNPWNIIDFGADVGGPIIKDRLWFYVGFSPSFNRTQTVRTVNRYLINAAGTDFEYDADGFVRTEELPGTRQSRFNDTRAFSYIGKLTFLINSDNNISLSVVGSPSTQEVPFAFQERRRVGNWRGGATTIDNSNTVSLRYQGGFLDKHLLVDVSLGWFRSEGSTLPNDGSSIDSTDPNTAAGAPQVQLTRNQASALGPYDLQDVETISAENLGLCQRPAGALRTVRVRGATRALVPCPVTGAGQAYNIGGFGFMQTRLQDRLSGRASVTYLMTALGHHIWKVGLDVENNIYNVRKGYSGGTLIQQTTNGAQWRDIRGYANVTGPDTIERTAIITSVPTSWGVGAFLQDSWAIMDVVTLNVGLRYESQQLFASNGNLGINLSNMFSPRIGLIYDFTQQGRSKLFANYARYFEAIPLNMADRALSGEPSAYRRRNAAPSATTGSPGCNPVADFSQVFNQCADPRTYATIIGGYPYDITPRFVNNANAPTTAVDRQLAPQSSDELLVGGEYEVITDGRVGVSYTKRWVNEVIEDMSIDEASTYFLGNPGRGQAINFPRAVRDYDAVSVYFNKAFADGWMAQVSYTWSYLRGNYNGLFRPETGQLDPNINSDFDLVSLLANRTGSLDADRTHFIKAYASKEFVISNSFAILAGLTYEGRTGAPINYYAAHPIYGADESFVLPRGSGGRVPFRHQINAKLGFSYRFNRDSAIQITADLFNLFNFQAVTAVDNRFSSSFVLPINFPPGSSATPQEQLCLAGLNNPACANGALGSLTDYDGNQLDTSIINPNFKKPTGYQAPFSVRFGVRFTF